MVGGEGVRLPLGFNRHKPAVDGTALGALHRLVGSGAVAATWRNVSSSAELSRSLLRVVVLVLDIVFIFVVIVATVVGVSSGAVRLVGLVIPQLAIGAVLGEQLGVRAALDRPPP